MQVKNFVIPTPPSHSPINSLTLSSLPIYNRRHFLAATATLLCTGGIPANPAGANFRKSNPMIDQIDLFPVRYPTEGHFKFFSGPRGSRGRAAVIVKITADDGTVGWGQSVPVALWSYETLETATIVIRADAGAKTGEVQELIRVCQDQQFEKFALRAK